MADKCFWYPMDVLGTRQWNCRKGTMTTRFQRISKGILGSWHDVGSFNSVTRFLRETLELEVVIFMSGQIKADHNREARGKFRQRWLRCNSSDAG